MNVLNNHRVSMRDENSKEHIMHENLSLYDALMWVSRNREKKDGNYYWIGGKRRDA